MGQQPNIELHIQNLPRSTPETAAPRRWSPHRPGELGSPNDVPWGGMHGTPGPDAGYALKLIGGREYSLASEEGRSDVDAVVAAVAVARASLFGRAPTAGDIDVALLMLGLNPSGLPDAFVEGIASDRPGWVAGAAHNPAKSQRVVAAIAAEDLVSDVAALRDRMAGGERLVAL